MSQPNPLRILFLDLDGVLNSARSCIALGGFPSGLGPASVARFDQVALGLVRGLCRAGDLQVVLSSSWRKLYAYEEIGQALDLPIIDRTPSLAGPRGGEIAAWLQARPWVKEWAIVDDDSDMLESQRARFVRTEHEEGLSWVNFLELCELFGVDPASCGTPASPDAV